MHQPALLNWGLRDYHLPPQVWPDGWRGSLGLEPDPDAYIRHLCQVFDELWRVLRDDGTAWLNLGDSMAANRTYQVVDNKHVDVGNNHGSHVPPGLKPKDLLGMPWRVALALQARGWYLRSAITLAKVNPMPESVAGSSWRRHMMQAPDGVWWPCPGCTTCEANDGLVLRMSAGRPTQATEMMFLLSKKGSYYFDSEAVKECLSPSTHPSGNGFNRNGVRMSHGEGSDTEWIPHGQGRNIRNFWLTASEAFPGAHFAVMPRAWVTPCIQAGTSERGCCAACGAPVVRVVERSFEPQGDVSLMRGIRGHSEQKPMDASNSWQDVPRGSTHTTTLGWRPSCTCAAAIVPCTVLDPFGGAGTVALCAQRLGRDAVLIELNPQYAQMARQRLQQDMPLFYEED